jgi:hypothetical protein
MHRLLYISTARQPFAAAELDALLRVSRRNNAAVRVTGLLIASGRRFLQVLEGPEEPVHATYERIRRDPRHFATVVLSDQPVTDRLFGGWAMGFQPGAPLKGETAVATDVAALVAPITDPTLRAYFLGFAQTQAAA